MTCPVIKCFKSREPAYRSSSILIPHFLSCFFFSFCLLSSSSSAFVFSGNGTEDIGNTSDLFLEILRDEAVGRLYELGKVSDASGYLERTFMSPASMRAINLIQTWMEDAGLRTWVDEMGNVHGRAEGANADAEALLIGSHLVDLYLLPQPAFPTGGLYF